MCILSGVTALDCNADTLIIDSQQDADLVPGCVSQGAPINKSLIISPEASGSIAFKYLEFINGSIYAEDSPGLTSLSLDRSDPRVEVLSGRVYDVVIRNLTAVESFSFPYVPGISLDSVLFENLPSLHTINISDGFPIDFRLRRLPSLRNLLLSRCFFGVTGSIEVNDVGLSSIDMLFQIGFAAKSISVDGIPNVTNLSYSLWTTKDVSIRGNGNLRFNFNNTDCDGEISALPWSNTSSIVVTGLGALERIDDREDRVLKLYVGTFTATNNSFSHLPIDFTNLTNLYITDNPELETLSYNANFTRYRWNDIVIRGNPKLKLTSSVEEPSYAFERHISTWVWPSVDISSIELDGQFDNAFLSVPIADGGFFFSFSATPQY